MEGIVTLVEVRCIFATLGTRGYTMHEEMGVNSLNFYLALRIKWLAACSTVIHHSQPRNS
jgi:hypothetical protein